MVKFEKFEEDERNLKALKDSVFEAFLRPVIEESVNYINLLYDDII